MALPESFIAGQTLADILTGDLTLDMDDNTVGRFRSSLWKDSWSGSVIEETTTAPYGTSPWNADEIDWSGYTAGGGTQGYVDDPVITSAADSRKVIWAASGAGSLVWESLSGASEARGLLISHHNGTSYTRPIVFINFGNDFAHDSGTFEVEWDPALGIFAASY